MADVRCRLGDEKEGERGKKRSATIPYARVFARVYYRISDVSVSSRASPRSGPRRRHLPHPRGSPGVARALTPDVAPHEILPRDERRGVKARQALQKLGGVPIVAVAARRDPSITLAGSTATAEMLGAPPAGGGPPIAPVSPASPLASPGTFPGTTRGAARVMANETRGFSADAAKTGCGAVSGKKLILVGDFLSGLSSRRALLSCAPGFVADGLRVPHDGASTSPARTRAGPRRERLVSAHVHIHGSGRVVPSHERGRSPAERVATRVPPARRRTRDTHRGRT